MPPGVLVMSIDVVCPCGKRFKIPEERAGTKFKCYLCNADLLVPGGPPQEPPPVRDTAMTTSPTSALSAAPLPEFLLDDPSRFVTGHLRAGTPRRQIVQMLQEGGIDRNTALELVSDMAHVRPTRYVPLVSIVVGGLFLASGLAISVHESLVLDKPQYAGVLGSLLFGGFLLSRGLKRLFLTD
jgi:hypothetical protein